VTVAGSGEQGSADGPAHAASFDTLRDVSVSVDGSTCYLIDGYKVRTVDLANNSVATLAGSDWGHTDGVGPAAMFEMPTSLAAFGVAATQKAKARPLEVGRSPDYSTTRAPSTSTTVNPAVIAVCDSGSNTIRLVSAAGRVTTLSSSGEGSGGAAAAEQPFLVLSSGGASSGGLASPRGAVTLPDGRLLVADSGNNCLRTFDPSSGAESVFAGPGASDSDVTDNSSMVNGGWLADVEFDHPECLAVDVDGRVVVVDVDAESRELRIQVIDPVAKERRVLEFAAVVGGQGPESAQELQTCESHNNTPPQKTASFRDSLACTFGIGLYAARIIFADVAIGISGELWIATEHGVCVVTGVGLAPGYHAWTNNMIAPTAACFHHELQPEAQAAVWAVLTSAVRCQWHQHSMGPVATAATSSGPELVWRGAGHSVTAAATAAAAPVPAPALPLELWFVVLTMIRTWELGSRVLDDDP
jgi:hypothetical protein